MRVLILGARGMLGKDLEPVLGSIHQVLARDVEDFDITDPRRARKEIEKLRPQIVINTAAYTDVDGCESKKDLAFSVNADGARNVAEACATIQARMIHLSTDYVFDGSSPTPYREEDLPNPLNVYGLSKLRGEQDIQKTLRNYLIIRTQWLYGRHGKNFVDTIIRLSEKQNELRMVNDQRGSPTFTQDLSWAIKQTLEKNITGTLHITNSGSCTWFELARQIFKEKKPLPGGVRIIPISSAELPRPARRPENSALDCSRWESIIGQKMRPWKEALKEYLAS